MCLLGADAPRPCGCAILPQPSRSPCRHWYRHEPARAGYQRKRQIGPNSLGDLRRGRRAPRGRCASTYSTYEPGYDVRLRRRCRSRRPARARGCSGRAGTPGRATRRASCRRSPASASTSISFVARSRWLVGSSSTRKFGGSSSIRAITSRVFSPPESARIFLSTSSPENWNAPSRLAQRADRLVREVLLQLLLDREVGVEQVERLLREVAQLEARAEADCAGVGRQAAGDHLEQRRLAGAVAAHHAPALAAADRQVQAVVDDARSVRLAHALEHGHLVAGARRLPEVELHDLPLLRQLDPLDLLQRLHAALHLRRLGGVGREALDEALLLGQHRLLARVGRLAVGLADARARARRSRSCPSRP